MWQQLLDCMGQRRVAVCIPWKGEPLELVYWYGILAALGIALGALYASKHMQSEGDDPDLVWDALLWILIPALLGARLWYVAQVAMSGSTYYSLSRPLEILNPRLGGMNIFGGAIFGMLAMIVFAIVRKVNFWLLTDGALMGLLVGQGIGRFGNLINIELYGPPTNSDWFGMIVPAAYRMAEFRDLPAETRFHPTMLYEAFWLLLCFGVLYYLFRRYQERFIHGVLTGCYFVLAGIGRFIIEWWRPDQPGIQLESGAILSYSRILSMVYVVIGIIIVLDRMGYLRIPGIARPQTQKQRAKAYEELMRERDRQERARERERQREERRLQREERARIKAEEEAAALAAAAEAEEE
ncbi:MAG: prolipoprotein diacylglyceryl transferase [Anaerolineae bacterium]|nr:prolipoprotein diacylglyceryl transferase [Anaerolineae bacterium]